MCGIVGYVGSATPSTRPLDVALEGLGRLEYRGYDSAGVALVAPGRDEVAVAKKAGNLSICAQRLLSRLFRRQQRRLVTRGGPPMVPPVISTLILMWRLMVVLR